MLGLITCTPIIISPKRQWRAGLQSSVEMDEGRHQAGGPSHRPFEALNGSADRLFTNDKPIPIRHTPHVQKTGMAGGGPAPGRRRLRPPAGHRQP